MNIVAFNLNYHHNYKSNNVYYHGNLTTKAIKLKKKKKQHKL